MLVVHGRPLTLFVLPAAVASCHQKTTHAAPGRTSCGRAGETPVAQDCAAFASAHPSCRAQCTARRVLRHVVTSLRLCQPPTVFPCAFARHGGHCTRTTVPSSDLLVGSCSPQRAGFWRRDTGCGVLLVAAAAGPGHCAKTVSCMYSIQRLAKLASDTVRGFTRAHSTNSRAQRSLTLVTDALRCGRQADSLQAPTRTDST